VTIWCRNHHEGKQGKTLICCVPQKNVAYGGRFMPCGARPAESTREAMVAGVRGSCKTSPK